MWLWYIHDDSLPRGFWKLGLVKDGVTRGALVRLAPKDGRQSLLHQPIQRLYLHQKDNSVQLEMKPQNPCKNLTMPLLSLMVRQIYRSHPERRAAQRQELVFYSVTLYSVDDVWPRALELV